jgi:hypothetical protein
MRRRLEIAANCLGTRVQSLRSTIRSDIFIEIEPDLLLFFHTGIFSRLQPHREVDHRSSANVRNHGLFAPPREFNSFVT